MNKKTRTIHHLLESEAVFNTLTDKSPNMIFIIHNDRMVYVNDKCEKMLGYTKKEFYSPDFDIMSLVHPDFAKLVIDNFKRHMAGEKTEPYEFKLLAKDGKELTVIHASRVLDHDGTRSLLCILTDITCHKMAEEALKESEHKYRSLVEKANDAIFIADVDTGRIIDANRKAEELLGIPLDKLIGMHQAELHPPEDRQRYREIFLNHISCGEGRSGDLYVVNSSGRKIPVDISASITEISGKKVIQGIFRDISDRKRIEAEQTKHHEHLEGLVQARTHELLEANKSLKLEVKVRKKAEKQLLDYQKQLQTLSSQLSLIEENEKRRIATELHDCIGQTLALSKIKLGLLNKALPSPEHKKTVREIQHLIEQTIKETRTLTFELSPPILYELGLSQAIKWLIDQFHDNYGLNITLLDDGREIPFDNTTRFFIFQAVRELLVNIVKHARATDVKITVTRDEKKLNIVVEDNGIGVPKKSLRHDGYGLFSIRERMNHINGNFNITSSRDRGTKVSLEAPVIVEKTENKKE